MKKLIFVCCTLLCVTALMAQRESNRPRATVEERAKRTTEWMTQLLNLTPEQIPPVDSINLVYAKTQQVLFQSAEGDREKIRAALTALEEKKQEALATYLTEDQMKAYRQRMTEMQNRPRNSNRPRPIREE
ncbi:MAG: hypothetical protein LBM08_11510 [Dysgonamonadaceae bacterium]|jgi:hypothetical protein|nr:hypothetical protein [Dysgonamonadaceae bacterium]